MEQGEQILNTLPRVLADWRETNKSLISQINQRRKAFKISNPDVLNSGEDRANMGIKYSVPVGEKLWNIFINKNTQPSSASLPPPFITAFEIRQNLEQLVKPPEELSAPASQRQQTVDFLAANWPQLAKIFYQNPPEETPADLPCFTEVELNDGKTIAFIGIGPDEKVIIVDVFDQKNTKDFNYYLNQINSLLKNLARPLRLSLTEIDPNDLSVYYMLPSFTNSANNLIITPFAK